MQDLAMRWMQESEEGLVGLFFGRGLIREGCLDILMWTFTVQLDRWGIYGMDHTGF